jgi:hypothetical protein
MGVLPTPFFSGVPKGRFCPLYSRKNSPLRGAAKSNTVQWNIAFFPSAPGFAGVFADGDHQVEVIPNIMSINDVSHVLERG